MAQKLFMRGPGSGSRYRSDSSTTTVVSGGLAGGSGMMLLLLLIPIVLFIIFNNRNKGKSSGPSRERGDQGGEKQSRDERKKKEKEAEEKKKKDEKPKQKPRSDPGMVHSPARDDPVYDDKHKAQPDNPFYVHHGVPADWTGETVEAPPIYKKTAEENANVKSATRPYKDGQTVQDGVVRRKKSVSFEGGGNNEDISLPAGQKVVKEVAMIDPLSTVPVKVGLENFSPRSEGGSGRRHSEVKKGAVQPKQLASLEISVLGTHLTAVFELMQKPPLSLAGADLEVFRRILQLVTAKWGSDDHKATMVEAFSDLYGPYPNCVNQLLTVVERLLNKKVPSPAKPETMVKDFDVFLSALAMCHEEKLNLFIDRLKLRNPNAQQFLNAWFFEQFRLLHMHEKRNVGFTIPNQLDEDEKNKTRGAFQLFKFVGWVARALSQIWLMSPRGLDLYGMVLRASMVPHEIPLEGGKTHLHYSWIVGLFLPSTQGGATLGDWRKDATLAGGSWHTVRSLTSGVAARVSTYLEKDKKDASCQSRLVIRPGWTVQAVVQNGDGQRWHERSNRVEWKSDGIPLLDTYPKGEEAEPGGELLFRLFQELLVSMRPQILDFQRRGQFSWSGNSVPHRSTGFPDGQILMCLKAMGYHVTAPRHDKEGLLEEGDITTISPDGFIETINFGDSIPLEVEEVNGQEVYTFYDLKWYTGLKQIFLPYASVPANPETATARDRAPATAILALSKSAGLWKQLSERKLTLVVITRDLPGVDNVVKPAQEWRERLVRELKTQGEKEGVAQAEWKERIKWVEQKEGKLDILLQTPQPLNVA